MQGENSTTPGLGIPGGRHDKTQDSKLLRPFRNLLSKITYFLRHYIVINWQQPSEFFDNNYCQIGKPQS